MIETGTGELIDRLRLQSFAVSATESAEIGFPKWTAIDVTLRSRAYGRSKLG